MDHSAAPADSEYFQIEMQPPRGSLARRAPKYRKNKPRKLKFDDCDMQFNQFEIDQERAQ